MLVLENQVDFKRYAGEGAIHRYIRDFIINQRSLSMIFADVIIDIMKNSYRGRDNYDKLQEKWTLLHITSASHGCCNTCKQAILNDNNDDELKKEFENENKFENNPNNELKNKSENENKNIIEIDPKNESINKDKNKPINVPSKKPDKKL